MLDSSGSKAFSVFPNTPAPYKEALVRRKGYTETTALTHYQAGACIVASSAFTAIASRPIAQLFRFSFISDIPGNPGLNGLSGKRAMFWQVIFNTRWFSGAENHEKLRVAFLTYCLVLSTYRFLSLQLAMHFPPPPPSWQLEAEAEAERSTKTEGDGSETSISSSSASTPHPLDVIPARFQKENIDRNTFSQRYLSLGGWPLNGFLAGAGTGLLLATLRHPYDVLRATAQQPGPKNFSGPFDVLFTSLRHKPEILKGLYRGFGLAATASTLQCAAFFWIYGVFKYDAVRNNDLYLYLLCHFSSYIGHVAQFPFHNLKQSWLARQAQLPKRTAHLFTMRQHLNELRYRHGITMVYDGFFRVSPFWTAAPAAIALFCFDKFSRRYTEYLHPELRQQNSKGQTLIAFY